MDEWLLPADVADYLGDAGLASDPQLALVCRGIAAYLQSYRAEVFVLPPVTDPPTVWAGVPADLKLGAIMWAAHSFQLRSAPSGFASYGDGAGDTMFDLSLASNRTDIYRLCGLKKPVTS